MKKELTPKVIFGAAVAVVAVVVGLALAFVRSDPAASGPRPTVPFDRSKVDVAGYERQRDEDLKRMNGGKPVAVQPPSSAR